MGVTRTAVLTVLLWSIQPAAAQTLGPAADAATAAVPTPDLTPRASRGVPARAGAATATVCVRHGGQLNVRASARSSGKVMGTLKSGDRVRVTGSGKWRRVVLPHGAVGYVLGRFVCK